MVSKKLELAGYDPRGLQGMGLAYATSPIGASHCRAHMGYTEMVGIPQPTDRHEWKGKGSLVKRWQDVFSLIDATGICIMFSIRNLLRQDLDILPDGILEYLNAVTGAAYTLEELTTAGERILNAERLFMARAGFDRRNDTLPIRLLREPQAEGPSKDRVVELERMLDEYYECPGMDRTGHPHRGQACGTGFADPLIARPSMRITVELFGFLADYGPEGRRAFPLEIDDRGHGRLADRETRPAPGCTADGPDQRTAGGYRTIR